MQYYTNKATVLPKDDCVMRRCVDCTENLFPQRLTRTCTDEKGKSSSTKSSGSNHWIGIDDINTHWAGPIVIFLKTRLTCVADRRVPLDFHHSPFPKVSISCWREKSTINHGGYGQEFCQGGTVLQACGQPHASAECYALVQKVSSPSSLLVSLLVTIFLFFSCLTREMLWGSLCFVFAFALSCISPRWKYMIRRYCLSLVFVNLCLHGVYPARVALFAIFYNLLSCLPFFPSYPHFLLHFLSLPVNTTHPMLSSRAYRSLRNLSSWVESRELWCQEATKVRARFDIGKSEVVMSNALRMLREGEEELADQTHPDNYIASYMPGGSLFMRNPAIPLEVMYPHGIPEGKSRRRINIDMSNVPDEDEYGAQVMVDSASKQYWMDR